MNDTKNILLAWISSLPPIISTIEAGTLISIVSAIVLPITFFFLGKTIDVAVQIYLKRPEKK
ncbi:MAG: hypothetical protein ABL999_06835 [Pyrinomonadaceae bacterium]